MLVPKVDGDGKSVDGKWFDVTRLELKKKKRMCPVLEVNNAVSINQLGFKAKDRATGVNGVGSSVGVNMYGHEQFTLTPSVDSDGKYGESGWFDISRLVLKGTEPVMASPDFDKGYIADGKKGPAEKMLPV